jgi:hypothetical protein
MIFYIFLFRKSVSFAIDEKELPVAHLPSLEVSLL